MVLFVQGPDLDVVLVGLQACLLSRVETANPEQRNEGSGAEE